eukprot:s4922_g5.t1
MQVHDRSLFVATRARVHHILLPIKLLATARCLDDMKLLIKLEERIATNDEWNDETFGGVAVALPSAGLVRPMSVRMGANSFKMYLPKTVNIANPRINVVFFFLELVTVGLAIWYFVSPDKYSQVVVPDVQVTMCDRRCEPCA